MQGEVIAVFDIGKTNKKFLLFDAGLNLVHQEEEKFSESHDEDGFSCDDIGKIEDWMLECLSGKIREGYLVKALNFSTYGASLMHLDARGKKLTPVYNYLKPMPEDVLEGFYESYGGVEEFSRKTASPALGMLNSGLQILWLKRKNPGLFSRVRSILHFPQYLSYCFTEAISSEYTSIGCHTALWDFDNHAYHAWLQEEGIILPRPVPNTTATPVSLEGQQVKTGIGIHDSSSSLVPYFMATREEFILLSTGTWCIMMNPFNPEPLTAEQLRKDSLCYMSIQQKQVKSSRLFMGHIHDVNVDRMNQHFGTGPAAYKTVIPDERLMRDMLQARNRVFFRQGVPVEYVDTSADLGQYKDFGSAYHQLVHDLVDCCMESLQLIIPVADNTRVVYISGGFARNDIFTRLLAARMPGKKVYTSEMDNASALGAAMVVYEAAFGRSVAPVDLGLKLIEA